MIASTGSQHLSITTAPVAFIVSRSRPLFASIAGESSLYCRCHLYIALTRKSPIRGILESYYRRAVRIGYYAPFLVGNRPSKGRDGVALQDRRGNRLLIHGIRLR
jgi:hypothetical protein